MNHTHFLIGPLHTFIHIRLNRFVVVFKKLVELGREAYLWGQAMGVLGRRGIHVRCG